MGFVTILFAFYEIQFREQDLWRHQLKNLHQYHVALHSLLHPLSPPPTKAYPSYPALCEWVGESNHLLPPVTAFETKTAAQPLVLINGRSYEIDEQNYSTRAQEG